jgi:hypothetical protein
LVTARHVIEDRAVTGLYPYRGRVSIESIEIIFQQTQQLTLRFSDLTSRLKDI